ncbi:MAG: PDZ domain-containing protein [Phycisphaerae bacterium]|nr:PDZ domain-containing protein [Phycisphaerae bacterium]
MLSFHSVVSFLACLSAASVSVQSAALADPSAAPVIVKLAPTDQPGQQPKVVVLGRVATSDDPNIARIDRTDIAAGGPWIGVQFGPLPKPLRAHLKLSAGVGQMVLNVAEGSPAEAAGIQQYDIITAMDGRESSSDMGAFLDSIRAFAPNETHLLSVIREGAPIEVKLVVGSRPENWADLKYKYEMDEEVPFAGRQLFRRGGMLEKDAQGNWMYKDLDQLNEMSDIWSHIPQFNPDDLQFSWQQSGPDAQNQVQVFVNKGVELRIERGDDGKITVNRTERDGDQTKTSSSTYDNEDAFKAADPETYKSYKGGFGGEGRMFFKFNPSTIGQGPDGKPFGFEIELKELHEAADAMRKEAEAAQQSADSLRQTLRKKVIVRRGDGAGAETTDVIVEGKAATVFEVEADGAVRVTTRNGDSEIVERFSSIDAMKAARPELAAKYDSLRSAAGE